MIPRDYITEWRAEAPWVQDFQIEQDLIIAKALVEIFSHPLLRDTLALRGGTALYKLHLRPAARYSEDIDLVQIEAEPAGPISDFSSGGGGEPVEGVYLYPDYLREKNTKLGYCWDDQGLVTQIDLEADPTATCP